MQSALKDRVLSLIQCAIKVDLGSLDPQRDLWQEVSFDSLQLVELTAKVEKELGVELPLAVLEVRTLNEFLAIVDQSAGESPTIDLTGQGPSPSSAQTG